MVARPSAIRPASVGWPAARCASGFALRRFSRLPGLAPAATPPGRCFGRCCALPRQSPAGAAREVAPSVCSGSFASPAPLRGPGLRSCPSPPEDLSGRTALRERACVVPPWLTPAEPAQGTVAPFGSLRPERSDTARRRWGRPSGTAPFSRRGGVNRFPGRGTALLCRLGRLPLTHLRFALTASLRRLRLVREGAYASSCGRASSAAAICMVAPSSLPAAARRTESSATRTLVSPCGSTKGEALRA